jgi:hypothetical protein
MMVLVMVGAVLVGFGALVLLKFPDRPGGRIAWHGFEVNSVGAGLPLIALGVVAIAIAGPIQFSQASPGSPPADPTTESGSAAVTGGTTVTLEDGTRERDIVAIDEPKEQPVRITFTQDGRPIGALTLLPFPEDGLFKVQDVVDARSRPVAEYSNSGRGGPKNVLQNWDTLHLRLEERLYQLRVGGFDTVSVNFEQVAE